jgi:hypothetical protein
MASPTIDDFFGEHAGARQIFEAIRRRVERLGDAGVRVSKSQIAFRRRRNLAVVWRPSQYRQGRPTAPLVLTFCFPERGASPRWKEIIEVGPQRFTHHLELDRLEDVDEQVGAWLRRAWDAAGRARLAATGGGSPERYRRAAERPVP